MQKSRLSINFCCHIVLTKISGKQRQYAHTKRNHKTLILCIYLAYTLTNMKMAMFL